MRDLRFREKIFLGVIAFMALFLLFVIFGYLGGLDTLARIFGPSAPTLLLFVAAASLVVAAVTTLGGWQRNRRQATLEAWTDWSNSTHKHRVCVSKKLGLQVIEVAQGEALATADAILVCQGAELTADEKHLVLTAVVKTLNGLERLAIGVERGIYDIDTFRGIGGTIIVRTYERFEPYVRARRNAPNKQYQQANAFTSLEAMCSRLNMKTAELDAARLSRLRR